MPRRIYILSRLKMPALETGPGELVLEDMIDIASDRSTRIVDDENTARTLKSIHRELKHCYVFSWPEEIVL
jgi:hypothetical protein